MAFMMVDTQPNVTGTLEPKPTPLDDVFSPPTSSVDLPGLIHQPDLNTIAGWPSMLIDGAQNPAFEPKVVVLSRGTEWPGVVFNATSGVVASGYLGSRRNGLKRWEVELGSSETETGANAGTNFIIDRYDDAGHIIAPSPLVINRASGMTTIAGLDTIGPLVIGTPPESTLTVTPGPDPTTPVTITSSLGGFDIIGVEGTGAVRIIDQTELSTGVPLKPPHGDSLLTLYGKIYGNVNCEMVAHGGAPILRGYATEAIAGGAFQPTGNTRNILIVAGGGYDGVAYQGGRGAMWVTATENWTTTANGTQISWITTANGQTTQTTSMTLANSGNLLIGTTTDSGARVRIVGGVAPTNALLTVRSNGVVQPPGANYDQRTVFVGQTIDGQSPVLEMMATGGPPGVINFNKANGTAAAPTPVLNGQSIGTVRFAGFDGAVWAPSQQAAIIVQANGDWSPTSRGTQYLWQLTPSGSIAIGVGMRLTQLGLQVTAGFSAWNVTPPAARPTITGSRTDGTALASLIVALVATGLVLDGTTA